MTRREAMIALEQRLESELGATGKTYLEKIQSLESRLPKPLFLQLQALPTLSANEFEVKLVSSHKQIGFFARTPNVPPPERPWTEAERSEARAKIAQGSTNTRPKQPKLGTRVAWWCYDQKRAIPARAQRLSRFRWLGALAFGAVGAFVGWSLRGQWLAAGSFVIWAALALWLLSEQNTAKGLWVGVRLLEILWRLLPVLVLGAVLGLVWLWLR
ncbi:MAG: hypothetical protein ACK41E_04865 [Deinococcales bacterium]